MVVREREVTSAVRLLELLRLVPLKIKSTTAIMLELRIEPALRRRIFLCGLRERMLTLGKLLKANKASVFVRVIR